jgi:hypothetical protein
MPDSSPLPSQHRFFPFQFVPSPFHSVIASSPCFSPFPYMQEFLPSFHCLFLPLLQGLLSIFCISISCPSFLQGGSFPPLLLYVSTSLCGVHSLPCSYMSPPHYAGFIPSPAPICLHLTMRGSFPTLLLYVSTPLCGVHSLHCSHMSPPPNAGFIPSTAPKCLHPPYSGFIPSTAPKCLHPPYSGFISYPAPLCPAPSAGFIPSTAPLCLQPLMQGSFPTLLLYAPSPSAWFIPSSAPSISPPFQGFIPSSVHLFSSSNTLHAGAHSLLPLSPAPLPLPPFLECLSLGNLLASPPVIFFFWLVPLTQWE